MHHSDHMLSHLLAIEQLEGAARRLHAGKADEGEGRAVKGGHILQGPEGLGHVDECCAISARRQAAQPQVPAHLVSLLQLLPRQHEVVRERRGPVRQAAGTCSQRACSHGAETASSRS